MVTNEYPFARDTLRSGFISALPGFIPSLGTPRAPGSSPLSPGSSLRLGHPALRVHLRSPLVHPFTRDTPRSGFISALPGFIPSLGTPRAPGSSPLSPGSPTALRVQSPALPGFIPSLRVHPFASGSFSLSGFTPVLWVHLHSPWVHPLHYGFNPPLSPGSSPHSGFIPLLRVHSRSSGSSPRSVS